MRGPKSLAGLMAYPVGPPNDKPMPNTNSETGNAFSVPNEEKGSVKHNAPNINTNVPMNSVMILCKGLRMAGAVQNIAFFRSASEEASKCLLYASHTNTAPVKAPANCASRYEAIKEVLNAPVAVKGRVQVTTSSQFHRSIYS